MTEKFKDKEYRAGYVEASTTGRLCYQIRALREQRGWSQEECARRLGMTQASLSRLECKEGQITLKTILRLAEVFDVAPLVKFVTHKKFIRETNSFTPRSLRVEPYAALNIHHPGAEK